MLIAVFLGSFFRPLNDDWSKISLRGWELHPESVLGQMIHNNIGPNHKYYSPDFYSEKSGIVDSVYVLRGHNFVQVTDTTGGIKSSASFQFGKNNVLAVKTGQLVAVGDVLYSGGVYNKVLFVDISRFLLTLVFVLIGFTIYYAYRKRKRERRI
jgi:hypothetical protein